MLMLISFVALLCFGVAVGVFTERLASRRVASILTSHNQIWPTLVKCFVSWCVWKYVIFHPWHHDDDYDGNGNGHGNDFGNDFGNGNGMTCVLPAMEKWGMLDENNVHIHTDIHVCEGALEGIKVSTILFLRCACFYMGAFFGAALQPIGLTGGIACGKSTVARLLSEPSTTSSVGINTYGTRSRRHNDAIAIVDVDKIAHDILVPGKMGSDCGYKRVVDAFHGADIFVAKEQKPTLTCTRTNENEDENENENPTQDETQDETQYENDTSPPIDRRKLGDIIFRDVKKRRALNGITHPLISKIMLKQAIREKLSPSSDKTAAVAVDIPLLFEVGLIMRMFFAIKIVVACNEKIQLKRLAERNKDLSKEQCEHRIKSQMSIGKKVKMADIVIWNNGSMDDLVVEVEKARSEVMNRSNALYGITVANAIAYAGGLTLAMCFHDVIKLIAENSMLLQCMIGGDC